MQFFGLVKRVPSTQLILTLRRMLVIEKCCGSVSKAVRGTLPISYLQSLLPCVKLSSLRGGSATRGIVVERKVEIQVQTVPD